MPYVRGWLIYNRLALCVLLSAEIKMSEAQEIQYFDLRIVYENFNQSLLQDEDVGIESFMAAFNELIKWVKSINSNNINIYVLLILYNKNI